MITKSESIKELVEGLLIFHKEVGTITKDASNPFFHSSYASLPHIIESIKEPLQKAGLVVAQFPVEQNSLCTILMHSATGQYIQSTYTMTPAKNDPQGLGSLFTYARRYALAAVLGLAVDEDDDANAVSGTTVAAGTQQPLVGGGTTPTATKPKTITKPNDPPSQPQLSTLSKLLHQHGKTLADFGTSQDQLTKGTASTLIKTLIESKPPKKEAQPEYDEGEYEEEPF